MNLLASVRLPSLLTWVMLMTLVLALGVSWGYPITIRLDPDHIKHEAENGYFIDLPELEWPLLRETDGPTAKKSSPTRVFENDQELLAPHSARSAIRRLGGGRFSDWQGRLYFSPLDNSDPRTNGRNYVAVLRIRFDSHLLVMWLVCVAISGSARSMLWMARGMVAPRDIATPTGCWIGVALMLETISPAGGAVFWLCIGSTLILLIVAWATTHRAAVISRGGLPKPAGMARNLGLLSASTALAFAGAETWLEYIERRSMNTVPAQLLATKRPAEPSPTRPEAPEEPVAETPESDPEVDELAHALEAFGVSFPTPMLHAALQRSSLVTLPPEFQRRSIEVEGALRAYQWHGAVHVKDVNGMRHRAPFPGRNNQVLRILVFGDSLTYGEGIDEQWTYPRQLEALLSTSYDVEVLNLGVSGHQSTDILTEVRNFLPILRPDLVIYGMCFNDFLPSGIGQYTNNYAYAFPIDSKTKEFLTERSRLARLTEDAYNNALLELGLRTDFLGDILKDFTGYQQRFARDVAAMNELVEDYGLPPIVSLVLDQYPLFDSPGHHIARTAERHLQRAGMDVIEMEPYYRHFDKLKLRVSRWEGHPNEAAHAIWANLLEQHLVDRPEFEEFRNRADQ